MSKYFRFLCMLACALHTSIASAEARLQPFTADILKQVEAGYAGKPFLLVLWSVHCAPCFAEMELLSEALAQQPDLPVVLVATDAPDMREHVLEVLGDYGLDGARNYHFADAIPEKLHYLIDPEWFGELPRSYRYDANHQRTAHSGTLDQAQLAQWLDSGIRDLPR